MVFIGVVFRVGGGLFSSSGVAMCVDVGWCVRRWMWFWMVLVSSCVCKLVGVQVVVAGVLLRRIVGF